MNFFIISTELLAIQRASKIFTKEQLTQATMYASGQPCQMCRTAAQYAGIVNIVYFYSKEELQSVYPYEAQLRPLRLCKQSPQPLLQHIQQSLFPLLICKTPETLIVSGVLCFYRDSKNYQLAAYSELIFTFIQAFFYFQLISSIYIVMKNTVIL